jgi:hypothetical protein
MPKKTIVAVRGAARPLYSGITRREAASEVLVVSDDAHVAWPSEDYGALLLRFEGPAGTGASWSVVPSRRPRRRGQGNF